MNRSHRKSSFSQKDAWISLALCLILLVTDKSFIAHALNNFMPTLSPIFTYFVPPIICLIIPSAYLILRYGGMNISDYSLNGKNVLVLFLSFIGLFIYMGIIAFRGPYLPFEFDGTTLSEMSRFEFISVFLVIILIGPFLEELLFRKYILEIFRSKFSIFLAILLTALMETVLHFGCILSGESILKLIPLFFFFIAFCIIYIRSNLRISSIMHSSTNLMLYFISWR